MILWEWTGIYNLIVGGRYRCGPLMQHANSLLLLHLSRYQETLVMDDRQGRVVYASKISKRADRYVARKLWVAR